MIKYKNRQTGELIVERPPAEGMMKMLYNNPIGKLALLPLIKRKMISSWYGRRMDHPKSKEQISAFVDRLGIDMSESCRKVEEFETFNDFFYRKLKPAARPIQEGLVSPGDGRLLAFDRISEVNEFYIKGQDFTLSSFLQSKKIAEKYNEGQMIILRLAPNDYHRFHFPLSGTPNELSKIEGDYLSVSPIALASNFTRVFCQNKREYCELSTPSHGDILLAPVGATMVGSILQTYQPSQSVEKGDEMGYFAFGGSTVVMLMQPGYFKIDEDLIANTRSGIETYVKMGEKVASKIN